jgi:hypothetical protein
MGIQPDEGIAVASSAKKPAAQMQMAPVQAEFCCQMAFGAATPEEYTAGLARLGRPPASHAADRRFESRAVCHFAFA